MNKIIKITLLFTVTTLFLQNFPAYADNGEFFGEASENEFKIVGKTAENFQTTPAYKEIHAAAEQEVNYVAPTQDPYVYALTMPCTGISTDCNPVKCIDANGEESILHQALYALRGSNVKGIGTSIEWNDTDTLKGWLRGGTVCLNDLDLGDSLDSQIVEKITVSLSQEDFQSLPLAPAQLNLPNVQGHTLKNANTNIWAKAETQNLTTEINGSPVQVEATPVAYVFTYGDGQKLETTNPGYGLHEDDGWDVETPTSHIYKETGNYPVSVTTIYTGRYSVDGGPWLPVNGTAQATSEEKTVRVWRVRAGNVADTCVENPRGWGCPGT